MVAELGTPPAATAPPEARALLAADFGTEGATDLALASAAALRAAKRF